MSLGVVAYAEKIHALHPLHWYNCTNAVRTFGILKYAIKPILMELIGARTVRGFKLRTFQQN